MIKKIKVTNLQNDSQTMKPIKIDNKLKKLNFIIGENGSGKSSLINVLKNSIDGRQLPNFSYDYLEVNTTYESFTNFNSLNIKNIFAEMYYFGELEGLDVNKTAWINDPMNNDSNIFITTNNILISNKIISTIKKIIKEKYNIKLSNERMKIFDWKKGDKFTTFFGNNINHVIYRTNGIISHNNLFETDYRIHLINGIKKILLNRNTNFTTDDYKIEVANLLSVNTWLDPGEKNAIIEMFKKFATSSRTANIYLNTFVFPVKQNPILKNNIEYIHSERMVADAIKREKINFNTVKSEPLMYELKKNHSKFLIDYNNQLNSLLSLVKNKILNNFHRIQINDKATNNEVENAIKKSLISNNSSDLLFIKNIMESENVLSKAVKSFITNDQELIDTIKEINEMAKIINDCIKNINWFLSDTFRLKIEIKNNDICVVIKDHVTKVNEFKFSTGQNSIIYMLSNLFLTRKKFI